MNIEEAQSLGKEALKFLLDHQLEPCPVNYKFAYQYVQKNSDIITTEIDYYIQNGLRISQQILFANSKKNARCVVPPL